MCSDRDVHDAPPIVRQDDQHKQKSIRHGRDDEEIGGHDLGAVIREKRAPGLGGWSPTPNQVFRDRRLTDVDAELQEFAVETWRTPQRVRLRHRTNQRAYLGGDGRPATPATLPRPEEAKASPMPREDGVRLDDDDGPPVTPHA